MKSSRNGAVFGLALVAWALAGCSRQSAIEITNAWVRQPPPGQPVTAGYFDLAWTGSNDALALIGAASPDFARVEVHTTSMADGVARMRRLKRVSVAPESSIRFRPGGMHLMLFEPTVAIAELESTRITLSFEAYPDVTFPAAFSLAEPAPDRG